MTPVKPFGILVEVWGEGLGSPESESESGQFQPTPANARLGFNAHQSILEPGQSASRLPLLISARVHLPSGDHAQRRHAGQEEIISPAKFHKVLQASAHKWRV